MNTTYKQDELAARKLFMKERPIAVISAIGLLIGCIFGMAGTVVPSATLRSLAWAVDSAALILAGGLLTVYYFRKGYKVIAAGFLTFALGETVVFASTATNPNDNIPSFGAGVFLWALSISVLSLRKIFPLSVRLTGIISAVLFAVVSFLIFTGHSVNALTKPLPFYAYPFYAATLVGWAWTLIKKSVGR